MYCVDQMAPIELVVADRWAVVAENLSVVGWLGRLAQAAEKVN
jgi:hypothetical protein